MDRLCWNITNKCNEQCAFCFRDLERNELSLSKNKQIASKIIESRIQHVAFSGGEALLYDGIEELLEMIYGAGVSTTLITNCLLLSNETINRLSGNLDWLAIPLDSCAHIEGMRNEKHLEIVLRVLEYVQNKTDLNVKINTMVSRKNYREIDDVYLKVIDNYPCIRRWNLFEFTPLRGMSIIQKQSFIIDELIDKYICDFLQAIKIRDDLYVKYKRKDTLMNSYFVISPNGDVVKNYCDGQSTLVGNLLKDEIDIILSGLDCDNNIYSKRTNNSKLVIV